MQVTLLGDFKYLQFYSQSVSGWCGGVCEAALKYVADALDQPYRPADAMPCIRDFVGMVSFGYNRITDRVSPGAPAFKAMRTDVFRRQARYNFGGGLTPGSWVTDFSGNGWAYLRLYVADRTGEEVAPGSKWATGWFDGDVNHAGCVIWYGNEVCLFDPNVGGIHYTFTPNADAADFTQAMDLALELMYKKYDRMKGARGCNVVSAKNTVGAPE